MISKFKITNKLGPSEEWIPYNGTVELKHVQGVEQITGNDPFESYVTFKLNVDNKIINLICDSRTQQREPETDDGFIEMIYEGKCYQEDNIINQSKIQVSFGDYPNGDAKLVVGSTDEKCNYLETALYFLKLIDQIK